MQSRQEKSLTNFSQQSTLNAYLYENKAHYPQRFQKSRGRQSAIAWQAGAAACQAIADCPPWDLRL